MHDVGELAHPLVTVDVYRASDDIAAAIPGLGFRGGEALGVEIADDEVGAAPGGEERGLAADSAPGPCHQGRAAAQVGRVHAWLSLRRRRTAAARSSSARRRGATRG